jgi:hypothetical protein
MGESKKVKYLYKKKKKVLLDYFTRSFFSQLINQQFILIYYL